MWKDEQLEKLFASPVWRGCLNKNRRKKPGNQIIKNHEYWVPLIGVHSGMRLEEICQLYLEDIKCEEGIYFFNVNEEEDRDLKTPNSVRRVPIHKKLIELGFIEYVEKINMGENACRVFPGLKATNKGKFSAYYSKRFGVYRKEIGVYELLLDFHSFRHTVKTKLLNNDVRELIADEIIGHENPGRGMTNRYFKGSELKKLKAAVDTIKIPFPADNDDQSKLMVS